MKTDTDRSLIRIIKITRQTRVISANASIWCATIFPSSMTVRCRYGAEVATKKALSRKRLSHDGGSRRRIQGPEAPSHGLLALEDGTEHEREGGRIDEGRHGEHYKRTADADRNTLLKSGQRRGEGGG